MKHIYIIKLKSRVTNRDIEGQAEHAEAAGPRGLTTSFHGQAAMCSQVTFSESRGGQERAAGRDM